MGFFDFGTLISKQGVSVLIKAKDLKGVRLSLKVLANDIKAILVKLSFICDNSKAKGIKVAKGAKG